MDLGYRLPVYDIDIVPEKRSTYSRLAQNEMALGFFRSGLFDPRLADQAAACVDMMDFEGKCTVMEGIVKRGKLYASSLQAAKVTSMEVER